MNEEMYIKDYDRDLMLMRAEDIEKRAERISEQLRSSLHRI